ncbi:MAG: HAD family phosphatase [Candidatus Dojkabacteria bacterium]|nr:HAD family phosphatase [Candidatus Dojkabacteria bacterium]
MLNLKNLLKTKEAFIFDMDGTILDLEDLNFKGYASTVKKFFDLDLDNHNYQKYFSGTRTAEAFCGYLDSQKKKDFDVDELINDFRRAKRKNLELNITEVVRLTPGIREFLANLKLVGKQTCLATSTVKEFVDIIVDHFRFRELFDVIITAEDLTKGKPDPQIYNLAVDKLGVGKSDALVFEDSRNGIAAAKSADIYCVGIHTKGKNDVFVKKADLVITDFNLIQCLNVRAKMTE